MGNLNLAETIKNYWVEGNFGNNLELIKVVVNGINSQVEFLQRQEQKPQKPNVESIEKQIEWLNKCLISEYEYYERSKRLPYWFRTLSINRIEEYEQKINKCNFTSQVLKGIKLGISVDTIKAAKSYPISNLIEFNKAGFIKCLWHNEKTPSMKLYIKNNTIHCFGSCNKTRDAIDLVMKMENIDFTMAVKYLCQKMK